MKLFAFILILSLTIPSCANKKKASEIKIKNAIEVPQEEIIIPTDMINKGFLKAFIKDYSKSDDGCGFLIVIEETKQVLQPLKPLTGLLAKENLKIWIKYRPIRPIAPACKKGIIINIEEIKISQ